MNEQRADLVAQFDGAVAELAHQSTVIGWLAVQAAPYRDVLLRRNVGCWVLITWVDQTIEFEEDYPPLQLLREVAAGAWHDLDRQRDYKIRWATGEHRHELWDRYGVLQPPSNYLNMVADERRSQR